MAHPRQAQDDRRLGPGQETVADLRIVGADPLLERGEFPGDLGDETAVHRLLGTRSDLRRCQELLRALQRSAPIPLGGQEAGQLEGALGPQGARGRERDQERRHRIAIEGGERPSSKELRPVLAEQEAQPVDESGPIADQAVLVSGEDPHLGDRPGDRHEVAQRSLFLASDPGAHLGVDQVALVSLAATLATDGDLGRRERRHELAAGQQLADEDSAVTAIGLDHPEGLADPTGEPDDPRDELVNRGCVVVDSLADDLRVLGRAGDDAVAVFGLGRRRRSDSHSSDHLRARAQDTLLQP